MAKFVGFSHGSTRCSPTQCEDHGQAEDAGNASYRRDTVDFAFVTWRMQAMLWTPSRSTSVIAKNNCSIATPPLSPSTAPVGFAPILEFPTLVDDTVHCPVQLKDQPPWACRGDRGDLLYESM